MAKKRIIILGAGLAGLSAAWHFEKRGFDYQVYEKEPEVGGLCRSKNIQGFTFDYDGHLLHFKHLHTFNFFKDLLGNNLARHERNASIYSFDRYIRYPFQSNLHSLPLPVIKECLLGFIEASCNGRPANKNGLNFLDWANKTFGKGISRHFMEPYNSKFWTLSLKKLTCEWLDGFIPIPSLSQIIGGTIEEGKEEFGYNARFWYPKKGGINHVPYALASRIRNINTNAQITEINLTKKEIKVASGARERFDYLVSTAPLPEMADIIKDLPQEICSLFRKLKWNSVFNLNLGLDKKEDSGRHWVYFPDKNTCFFRTGFPHNFSNSVIPAGKSSLYVEIAYSKDKPIDKSNIILQIRKDLEKVGILSRGDNIYAQDINDIKYGYPIYDINYRESREKILRFFTRSSIIACGRYGSWRYMSMEDTFLDGIKAAGSI